MGKEVMEIVVSKCNQIASSTGMVTDSDIMDIVEECTRKNLDFSRKEIEDWFIAQGE